MKSILFIFFLIGCSMSFAQSLATTTQTAAPKVSFEIPVSVSADATFLYRNSNFYTKDQSTTDFNPHPNGLSVREVQVTFTAPVDQYTELEVELSSEPEYHNEGGEISEDWNIQTEEVVVKSKYFTDFNIKLGKFRAALGKQNLLHAADLTFIYAPLANEYLLGEEGFLDLGASVEWKLPINNEAWKSSLFLQYFRGEGENEQFNSATPSDGVVVAKFKNAFDLGSSFNLELGLSAAQGKNLYEETTDIQVADFTLNWFPDDNFKFAVLELSAEHMKRNMKQEGVDDEKAAGTAVWLQYNINQQWSTLVRRDDIRIQNSFDGLSDEIISRTSLAAVFFPSAHSQYKLEYSQYNGPLKNAKNENEKALFLQASFSVGAHDHH